MRGMIKWKPFNTILTKNDLIELTEKRKTITLPIIMEDRIIEINNILIKGIKENLTVEIKYFDKNLLRIISGKINKVNKLENYILINKTRIYFKNLINIKIL